MDMTERCQKVKHEYGGVGWKELTAAEAVQFCDQVGEMEGSVGILVSIGSIPCGLFGTYLIILKWPVSVESSIFCFSEPSLLGVALLCLFGLGTAPDLRDIVIYQK
jgi:hypothetical protein